MNRPVRRSQAISPFGIGALVDFPGPVSLIHAGLDAWPFDESNPDHREFKIEDETRLSRRLNVDFFVQPPDFRKPPNRGQEASQKNVNLTLPFLRFPYWHFCPRCGRMHIAKPHQITAPVCVGPMGSKDGEGKSHPSRKTVQVRFVAACAHGHLQDFPWVEWLFQTSNPDWMPDGVNQWLRVRSTGSSSLTGFEVRAEERTQDGGIRMIKKRTLSEAFSSHVPIESIDKISALSKLGIMCEGNNPALSVGKNAAIESSGCGQDLLPLLRGSSNLYFSQVVSSIYIPAVQDIGLPQEILILLDDYQFKSSLLLSAQDADDGLISTKACKNALKKYYPEKNVDPSELAIAGNKHVLKDVIWENGQAFAFLSQKIKISNDKCLSLEMVQQTLSAYYPDWEIDPILLTTQLSGLFEKNKVNSENDNNRQDSLAESDYRQEEYKVFCRDIEEGVPKTNLLIRSEDISNYGSIVSDSFERISLLHKLRETRAFVGYSRIFPENNLSAQQRLSLISGESKNWLPAIVVRGEGIFLKFSERKLLEWLDKSGNQNTKRLIGINKQFSDVRIRRNQEPQEVSAKRVLIHTFAHLLINQLVYECGYGSASLRERIYVSDGKNKMSGVLIYTAAGDSEGTMGGLVRMGRPGELEIIIKRALEKASWCSSDPICIESHGQGPDNCNVAACHSCALLPETSCEEQNRLLDRGVVIGTLECPDIGFFQSPLLG